VISSYFRFIDDKRLSILGLSGRSKSCAQRLFTFPPLGPLDAVASAFALPGPADARGASFSPEALAAVFERTQGYSFYPAAMGLRSRECSYFVRHNP
jgi:hypothetical protein